MFLGNCYLADFYKAEKMNLSFKEGDWVDFDTWTTEFGVSGMSGINISSKHKTIVCVSTEHGDGVPYEDKWYSRTEWDGVRFTGEGLKGDQTLTKGNKHLKEDKRAYFFRKKKGGRLYLYCGLFNLVDDKYNPKSDLQNDIDGNRRNVWMFNMKYAGNHYPKKLADEMSRHF